MESPTSRAEDRVSAMHRSDGIGILIQDVLSMFLDGSLGQGMSVFED